MSIFQDRIPNLVFYIHTSILVLYKTHLFDKFINIGTLYLHLWPILIKIYEFLVPPYCRVKKFSKRFIICRILFSSILFFYISLAIPYFCEIDNPSFFMKIHYNICQCFTNINYTFNSRINEMLMFIL